MVVVTEHHPWYAVQQAQQAAALEPVRPQFFAFDETRRHVVGLDIGQSNDPSAVCVLEHAHGIIDSGTSFERAHGLSGDKQVTAERIDVRYLQRMPLGMSYPNIVAHVAELMQRPPLCGDRWTKPARLVIDQTGVGAPVGDLFEAAGMNPVRVTITGASVQDVNWIARDRAHVAKQHLVSLVDAALHSGTLRFASRLAEAPAMKDELLDFRRKLSETGRSSYSARATKHDDLVMSLCIGVWFLGIPPPPKITLGGY